MRRLIVWGVALGLCVILVLGVWLATRSSWWQASVAMPVNRILESAKGYAPVVPQSRTTVREIVKETIVVEKRVEVAKEVTRIVEKVVERPITVTQYVTVTMAGTPVAVPMISVSSAAASTVVTPVAVASVYRPQVTVETLKYLKGQSVSAAIGELDGTFDTSGWQGGYRVFPGTKLAEGTMQLLWTDFRKSEVEGCTPYHTGGRWGLHLCKPGTQMPSDVSNFAGGRAVPIVGDVSSLAAILAMPITPTISVATAPSASATVTPTQVFTCIARVEMGVILGKSDFVKEYNSFYEGRGYAFGGSVAAGGKVPAGCFFLGTFGAPIPAGAKDLKGGFLWEVTQETVAPAGGRWMRICK